MVNEIILCTCENYSLLCWTMKRINGRDFWNSRDTYVPWFPMMWCDWLVKFPFKMEGGRSNGGAW